MMSLRSTCSLCGATFSLLLLMGTQRLEWTTHAVEEGPELEIGSTAGSQEFNIDLELDMYAPGPDEAPVSLFLDVSAGFSAVSDSAVDTGSTGAVRLSLYPSDGSGELTDEVSLDDGRAGVYVSTPHIDCPAFGLCERSYVAVFDSIEGVDLLGWWTLTASAIGPRNSEDSYDGEVSIAVSER